MTANDKTPHMLAATRGLFHTANLVNDPKLEWLMVPAAPPDAALMQPPPEEPLAIISQMVRRGPDPKLVVPLLAWLARRPVERGLLAWDALWGGTFTPEEQPLVKQLRDAARAVRDVLPAAGTRGASFASIKPEAFVRTATASIFDGSSNDQIEQALLEHDLGGFEHARLAGGDYTALLDHADVRTALRSVAQLMALAHLPTLASFYLAYLWSAFGDEPALELLIELLLDVDHVQRLEGLPQRAPAVEHREWGEYIVYRNAISQGDPAAAWGLLNGAITSGESVLTDGRPHPRLSLVRAELAARIFQAPVPYEDILQIVSAHPTWVYPARVRARVAALGGEPLGAVDDFVRTFGNDARFWADQAEQAPPGAPWYAGLGARAAREATWLPHDLAGWSGLVSILSGGTAAQHAAAAELQARRVEQTLF
jgi:hypothetical protein